MKSLKYQDEISATVASTIVFMDEKINYPDQEIQKGAIPLRFIVCF